jgi:hypothetical protein
MSKALVLGAAALAFSAVGASAADLVAPDYGYAAPYYGAPAPVYAAPPAPVYTAPRVYVLPAPIYTPPPAVSGYYAPHPVPPEPIPAPIYDYAAGSGYEYTAPGYWNRGYWGPRLRVRVALKASYRPPIAANVSTRRFRSNLTLKFCSAFFSACPAWAGNHRTVAGFRLIIAVAEF